MPIDDVRLRFAQAADAARLASFAAAKFIEAYCDKCPVEQLEAYTRAHFTEDKLRVEIDASDGALLIAEADHQVIGYALLVFESRPECEIDARQPVQLKRIYIGPAWHGRGVAQLLLARCVDEAVKRHADVMWLAVWPRNPRAVKFYLNSGFKIAGQQPFEILDEVQLDHVMTLQL